MKNVPMADASSWRVELRYRLLCFMFSFLLNIDHGAMVDTLLLLSMEVQGGPKIFRE
jgi:hypothetical protein